MLYSMGIMKFLRDSIGKLLIGSLVPKELVELQHYFRIYQKINFDIAKEHDGTFIAISNDFHHGRIITSGKTKGDLEKNILDAILTSFEVPAIYVKEADIKVGAINDLKYAAA